MNRIDFGDEDEVLGEMAKELDIPTDELRIKEDRGLTDFGAGVVYSIEIRGGHKEWNVVEGSDEEHALAIAVVTQDLEEQPEMFNPHFIESHINEDRLRRDLYGDVRDMLEEELQDVADRRPDEFWRTYESEGLDAPEENEEGERREPTSSEVEELAQKQAEERLRDPMQYLEDIYDHEDAVKQAIEIAGLDVAAAAEEAVNVDGPAHFLSTYDGNTHESPSGLVYWRRN